MSLCGGHGIAVAPRSCHVQNGEVRWASHCWGHSFQPSNKLKPRNQLHCTFKRATATWVFLFLKILWYLVDIWWVPVGYHEKNTVRKMENKKLTGVGLLFSETSHRILCSGSMPTNTLKKSEVFVSLECCTRWTFLQNEVPKTLTLKQMHTSDTKNNLGFLQVWSNSPDEHSNEMWEQWSSQKTDLKPDPITLLWEPLSMSMTSKVVCKLFSHHPCLGLFHCLSLPK